MFGSGIGIGGLASGLDTTTLIQRLVALERLPVKALEGQKKTQQDKLSALSTFKNHVKDLQTKAQALAQQTQFLEFLVTPSQQGVAGFSATGLATAGSHTLQVLSLASIDRWAFDGVASNTTDLATGAGQTVAFDAGGTSYSIAIAQDASSLDEIAAAINQAASDDVAATVVNAGTDTSPSWRLVVTAKASGEDARISNLASTLGGLTIDGTGPTAQGLPGSANNLAVGLNAVAVIDGLQVERTTNDFSGVVTGVKITVESADPAQTINFTVEADVTAVKKKIKEVVTAFNAVMAYINDQSRFSDDTGPSGPLFGDAALAQVRRQVRSALFDVDPATVGSDTEGYSTLGLIGIRSQNDGTLLIDDTKLTEKLNGNLQAVMDLFVDTDGFDNGGAAANTPDYYVDTTADSGLASSLVRAIDRLLNSATGTGGMVLKGLFDARSASLNDRIKRINSQIDAKEQYLERYEQGLIMKFARLEDIMGGLNAQGAALQAALTGLIR